MKFNTTTLIVLGAAGIGLYLLMSRDDTKNSKEEEGVPGTGGALGFSFSIPSSLLGQ